MSGRPTRRRLLVLLPPAPCCYNHFLLVAIIMLSRLLATAVGRGSGARPPSLLAGSRARFSMMGRTAAFLRPSSVDARGLFRIRRPCSQKQVPQLMLPSALWGSRALSVPLSRPLLGRQWAIQEEGGASVTTSGSSTSSGSRKSQAGGRRGVRRKVTKPEGAGPVVVFGPHRALPLEAFEGQPVLVREELVALATELAAHDDLYYNRDKPLISDAEYDALALRLAALEDRHPEVVRDLREQEGYLSRSDRVGAPPLVGSTAASSATAPAAPVGARFAPVAHGWPMQSLDNAFSPEDVEAWATRLAKVLQEAGEGVGAGGEGLEYVAELKIDGVSLSLRYEQGQLVRGATRGNGVTGEDITANVLAMGGAAIPTSLRAPCPPVVEVRGEVYLSRATFQALNDARAAAGQPPLSNPRNAASGSLRQLDPAETRERGLGFFAYGAECEEQGQGQGQGGEEGAAPCGQAELLERLAGWGFEVARPWARCQGLGELLAFHARMEAGRARLPFDVDGVVYKLDSLPLRRAAGASTRAPRWALAHKFSPVEARTRVARIEVQVGRTGVLTPVAILEPVTVGGVVIGRATLHNFQDLARKDVREGDEVVVRRAGDVIPQVLGRAAAAAAAEEEEGERAPSYSPPTACPSCGGPVTQEEDQAGLYCPAGLSCPAQSLERLVHFASRDALDIKGLGGRRVEELVAWGLVASPVDIFGLEEREAEARRRWEEAADEASVPLPLAEREGWGARSTEVLFQAIAARRAVPLGRFIYALGIRHVGQTTALTIAEHFGSVGAWWAAMEELRLAPTPEEQLRAVAEAEAGKAEAEAEAEAEGEDEAGADEDKMATPKKQKKKRKAKPPLEAAGMDGIEGIGPILVESLRAFARDERNRRTVEALLQLVEVSDEGHGGSGGGAPSAAAGTSGEESPQLLAGQTVLFTGTLAGMTRAEAEARVRQLGGKSVKALSKKVSFVVAGEDPGSKLRKAQELGVPVLSETEWSAKLDEGV